MDTYGVMGDPVEHSLSPPMHAAAYDSTGLEATYRRFRVAEGDAKEAVRGASALGLSGLNVTIPHKRTVASLPSVELDDTAARIGAVNTLCFADGGGYEDGGEVTGYNTDASGALRALERKTEAAGKEVALLGAGGAARAIAFALTEEGATVGILNRTVERAENLAEDVRAVGDATAYPLGAIGDVVPDADIVVNATTVGMEEDASPVPPDALRPHHVVLDAVYTPVETRLLCDAREAGATAVDGAWMLLYQGAEAFEIWTGKDAPTEEMNAALRGAL